MKVAIRNAVRSAIRGAVRGTGIISRYFRTFDGSTTDAFVLDQQVLEIGDTAKISFVTSRTGVSHFMMNGVEFDAGDLLQLTNCTATIDGGAVADGADITAYRNAEIHIIEITATAQITLTHVGQDGSSAGYWLGELFDFSTTISGTILLWPMDTDSLLYDYARGYVPSVDESTEYVTNGTDWTGATGNTPPNSWTCASSVVQFTIASGELQYQRNSEGSGATSEMIQSVPTVTGKTYNLSIDLTAVVSGSMAVRVDNVFVLSGITALQTHEVQFVATSSSTLIQMRGGTSTSDITIDNISVKQTSNLVVNDEFTYNTDGWTDADTGTGVSTWASNALSLTGTDSDNRAFRYQALKTVVGSTYTASAECVSFTSGTLRLAADTNIVLGSQLAFESFTATGTKTITFTAITSTTYIHLYTPSVGGVGSMDNISCRLVEKSLRYSNFTASDIEKFTLNRTTDCWEAAVHADICYP